MNINPYLKLLAKIKKLYNFDILFSSAKRYLIHYFQYIVQSCGHLFSLTQLRDEYLILYESFDCSWTKENTTV